jgi:hypothetical protein
MSSKKSSLSQVIKAYNATWFAFKKHPAVLIPFLVFAFADFASLIILFLAPRMPLRLVFGPIIRTFWGEVFLHYPVNFLLLVKLASLTRMVLSVVLGSLLTGMAIFIVSDIHTKKQLNLKKSFASALKQYLSFFVIVFIIVVIFYFTLKLFNFGLGKYFISGHRRLLFLGPRIWMGPILMTINFITGALLQSLFVYAIPVLVIEKEKLKKAIMRSFVLFKKLFLPTFSLVCLPMLLYIPISVLNQNGVVLIEKVYPEIILGVLTLGIIVNSLVIDALVTVSTAFLYLENRE